MGKLSINQDPRILVKFESYPKYVRDKLNQLRNLIIETASELDSVAEIEETLKWGELSYIAKKGSTIRIDWKPKSPQQYALYFNCNSRLVETYRAVYGDLFTYQKNRAIVFQIDDYIPAKELKECLAMALQYHEVKNKVYLGD